MIPVDHKSPCHCCVSLRMMPTSGEKGSVPVSSAQVVRESTLAQEAADKVAEAEALQDESSSAIPSAAPALLSQWLWPHSFTLRLRPPRTHLSLATTRPSYSFASKDPLLIGVKAVLRSPWTYATILSYTFLECRRLHLLGFRSPEKPLVDFSTSST